LVLRGSYACLRAGFSGSPILIVVMTIRNRTLTGLALGAVGVVLAAGVYTEATRVPDQP
jgi:hypothetical protein